MLAAFKSAPLVAVAEHHRNARIHGLLREIIADPRFPGLVNDIVVEFGSGYYQGVMDRYVSGEEVSPEQLREVWRGTGQWLVWDSPLGRDTSWIPIGELPWPPMAGIIDALL